MNSETKTTSTSSVRACQNCKNTFTIEPDDFSFYEKIKVPPPSWCPECRHIRRVIWRNERILYKRKCNAPGHEELVISNYSPDVVTPIYDQKYWWSDSWNALDYGAEYDFSKPFMQQFKELLAKVPLPNLVNLQSFNNEYVNFTYQSKNCYLNFASDMNEDTAYLFHSVYNRNSFDLCGCKKMESSSNGFYSSDCYNTHFSQFSSNCIDSFLLYNCHNCQNCIACVNVRNGKYQILNQQYSKSEYEEKIKELNLGSHFGLVALEEQFKKLLVKAPRKYAQIVQSKNVSGDYIRQGKNCINCFDLEGPSEDCKWIIYGVPNIKDCVDGYGVGVVERTYEVTSAGDNCQGMFFSPFVWTGNEVYYSHFCQGSSNIFGCIGLHKQDYCILNKQYTKEEYEALIPKIIQQMKDMPYVDSQGRVYKYGEFFPPELSPFCYNETIAQEYFPLTKEQALAKGYRWKDPEARNYQITIANDQIPDNIKDINESILNEIIACQHNQECNEQCTQAFKIIPSELQFYQRMNLPLPRLCPNCRHYQRLKQRNPLKLWHRKCMHEGCENEFETSYSPDRPEVVYCESCYQQEVV